MTRPTPLPGPAAHEGGASDATDPANLSGSVPVGVPTVAEIADLTRRLRGLTTAGRDADPAERAAFLADKRALLARISFGARDDAEATGTDADLADYLSSGAAGDRSDVRRHADDADAETDGAW